MDLLHGFKMFQDSWLLEVVIQLWEAQGILPISNTFNHFWKRKCKDLLRINYFFYKALKLTQVTIIFQFHFLLQK